MLRIFNSKEMPFHIQNFSLPFIIKKEHIPLFLKKKEDEVKDEQGSRQSVKEVKELKKEIKNKV